MDGQCFVCKGAFNPRHLARINGDNIILVRQIATEKKDAAGRPAIEVGENARLCLNCNRSIRAEIRAVEGDPTCRRLNVLTQTGGDSCFFVMQLMELYDFAKVCKCIY